MWSSNVFNRCRTVWAYIIWAKYSKINFPDFKRILILSKRTRYELEKLHWPGLSDLGMEKMLRKRGTDFDTLMKHHVLHKEFHNRLLYEIGQHGVEVQSVNRMDYTEDAINWADLIIPAGGDGTFLTAASKIRSRDKPIVGFNSDPQRSEGYLCLPKPYSYSLSKGIHKVLKREFTWLFRNRIEITMTGPCAGETSAHLDECPHPNIFWWHQENKEKQIKQPTTVVLPYLALNEVFVGESLSSQVSYFEVSLPKHAATKVKCSGLCACTGTGSTSWHFSINRLSREKVKRILEIAGADAPVDFVTDKFNESLIFPPDDPRIFYTLRDLICAGVWPDPPGLPSDDFTQEMSIFSKCHSANLVIDGGRCYPFNDGTSATLTSHPSLALRTIVLK